jgi:hypothetical protein
MASNERGDKLVNQVKSRLSTCNLERAGKLLKERKETQKEISNY